MAKTKKKIDRIITHEEKLRFLQNFIKHTEVDNVVCITYGITLADDKVTYAVMGLEENLVKALGNIAINTLEYESLIYMANQIKSYAEAEKLPIKSKKSKKKEKVKHVLH